MYYTFIRVVFLLTLLALLEMFMRYSMSPARNPGMSLIKLFLAGNTGLYPDQERKIPGNSEITDVFPAKKSLISDIPNSWLGTGITR